MDPKELVIAGRSEVKKIRIDSPLFASIATYDDDKDRVTVEVDFLHNIKSELDDRGWKFYLWFLLCATAAQASIFGYAASFLIPNPILANGLAILSIGVFVVAAYKLISLGIKDAIKIGKILFGGGGIRKVASWHGAEHKVIEAYCRTGSADIETARETSPISDACGGRYAVIYFAGLLLIMAMFGSILFNSPTTLKVVIGSLGGMMLALILFPKPIMKVAIYLSRKLQKYWTIKEPGEKELWTAHCALLELLKAEENHAGIAGFQKYSVTYDREI